MPKVSDQYIKDIDYTIRVGELLAKDAREREIIKALFNDLAKSKLFSYTDYKLYIKKDSRRDINTKYSNRNGS